MKLTKNGADLLYLQSFMGIAIKHTGRVKKEDYNGHSVIDAYSD